MKKIVCMVLIFLLSISICACGGTDSGSGGDTQGDTQQNEGTEGTGTGSEGEKTESAVSYEPERFDKDELSWEFDEKTGTLSIHGEGPMREYTKEPPEWEKHKETITAVVLDDGITSIGAYAFYNYLQLKEVTIPDSVEVIDVSAFDYCWELDTITIPKSLKYVGDRAFYNTLLWKPENLVFPEGLEFIGDQAFHSALKTEGTVTLPASLKYLGAQAFTNAVISDFIVADDNENYCSDNHAIYTKDKKEILMVAPGTGAMDEFVIPDGVEKIASECFNLIQEIKTVVIPESVKEIEEGAFFSTFKLKEIIVDEGNANYKSENGLLLSRDGKLLLAWPDGTEDTRFEIPDGVERIGEYLFYGRYDGGYTVVIPEGVKEIGTMSLPQSTKSLALPISLEKIDDYVFYNGIAIEKITYNGTAEDWDKVNIGKGNDGLNVSAISMN